MTTTNQSPLLATMLNMTAFHREHEKFYAVSPREQAVVLQRHSRTLLALADQWTATSPADRPMAGRSEGAPDLNAPAALQLEGVLFMELLDRVDFTPASLRADLADSAVSARRLYAAAEMIDHAADLFSDFAGLVHDNEPRWRVFRARLREVAAAIDE